MLGRYLIFGEIGAGGSATVHFGRLRGPAGFGRTVALKRLHGHLASDPKHVSQFLAEARLTARIHHPNVVPLLDVIALPDGELLLVMDYVHGETLGGLLGAARRRQAPVPLSVASAVMTGVLLGLHAAHETASETGMPLGLVHGDVSPHNVIVGADGSARVLDFGIARVAGATLDRRRVMGTPAYMAPERFRDAHFDRRSDLFGAAVVLWEMLTLDRLFKGQGEPPSAERAVRPIDPPSSRNPAVPPALDAVVLKALKARPEDRYPTALAFARALETAAPPATSREVAEWVTEICGVRLRERAAELSRIEAVTAPELVSSNDLRREQTGDEDALSFSVLEVGESPLPLAAPERQRPLPHGQHPPGAAHPGAALAPAHARRRRAHGHRAQRRPPAARGAAPERVRNGAARAASGDTRPDGRPDHHRRRDRRGDLGAGRAPASDAGGPVAGVAGAAAPGVRARRCTPCPAPSPRRRIGRRWTGRCRTAGARSPPASAAPAAHTPGRPWPPSRAPIWAPSNRPCTRPPRPAGTAPCTRWPAMWPSCCGPRARRA